MGDNQPEIAKRLGKSRQWVTLATALIEPPDWLLQAYREGRCRGINELYDLRRLHGEHGEPVEAWAGQQPNITWDRLAELHAMVARPAAATSTDVGAAPSSTSPHQTGTGPASGQVLPVTALPVVTASEAAGASSRTVLPEPPQRSEHRVHVEFGGHGYQLVVSVAPDQAGCMYVRPLTGGPRRLAPVASLKLLGFVGG